MQVMDIDIIEIGDNHAKFTLSGVAPAFANGLRRSMLSEVPTLAIDEVNIYNNTSVVYDEQLALRLGLIPIKTDPAEFMKASECLCEGAGCSTCQVSCTLSAEGPKMVLSGDLIPADSANIEIADTNVPIVELKDKEVLVLEATVRLGQGKEHAKWQAGVACGYKNTPQVDVIECDACGACVKECPHDILGIENNRAVVLKESECILCKLCVKACEIDGIVVSAKEDSFIFNIESDGSYSAQDLVLNATSNLSQKATELKGILESL